MKICTSCKKEKPLNEFGPEKRVIDGRKACCRTCAALKSRGREEYYREHYRKNSGRRLAWMRENFDMAAWHKKRRLDPKNKLYANFGNLMRHSLKNKKAGNSWEAVVGYTVHDLIAHLSERFTNGMNFENYGKWHVDHIRPVASFSYQSVDDPQFKECWGLSNLQPLWAADNLRKHARIA